ncbi:MAG: YidC/Oxa1 family membrane protein insertase [Candidatus Pacebacteria bacterium]|nr:YidC/Oxa1 family membrane protein insertase [Candidatus Paceibacterota bacterium]
MFDTLFYNPIYNLVVFLLNYIPDAGFVVIITTIIIKLILFPLFNRQITNQIAMQEAKPDLEKVRKKMKQKNLSSEKKQAIALETMAVYKKHKVKPFSMIFLLILQIPIILALFFVFVGEDLIKINEGILYSFISVPEEFSKVFLNTFHLQEISIFLAILAGISQYLLFTISMPEVKFKDFFKKKEGDFMKDFTNKIQVNLKYGLPFFVAIILSFTLNAAVALYWITVNIFSAGQEFLVRKKKSKLREMTKNSEIKIKSKKLNNKLPKKLKN